MINCITEIEYWEDNLIGKTVPEVENLLEKKVDFENKEECIFILKSYCFGIINKKLHLFLHKTKVRDYYIGNLVKKHIL